jgi:hypothetical protein
MVSIKFAGQRKNSTSARFGFAFQITGWRRLQLRQ